MRIRHIYNIALAMTLAAGTVLTACSDEEIYRPAPGEEPTDQLRFNLPEVNEWSASRSDPDWLEQDWREGTIDYWKEFKIGEREPTDEANWNIIKLNRVDNRLFKRDFVTVGAAPDVSVPSDSTSRPYYDIDGDGKGDPGSYHKVENDHIITVDETRTAIMPLLSSDDSQTVGRVTMKAEPMTEKLMKRYEKIAAKYSAAGKSSRGYSVDDRNVTERYKDISVTAYCYTTCAQNYEELVDMECFDEHHEHNHKVELMYDSKVSYNKTITDATGTGFWTTDTAYYWTQMVGAANRVRFFAYAPYDIAVRTPDADRQKYPMILDPDQKRGNMDTPELDYLVPSDPKEQQDLSATAVTCPGDYTRTVPLKFNHLLTGVRILIDDYYMGTCITSIKIKGVRDHGRYTWTKKPDNLATSSDDNDVLKGTWDVDTEKEYVEYEFTHENGGLLDKPLPNELDGDQCRWEIIDFEYLMLVMPQVLTRDAIMEVTFQEEGQEPETHFAHIDCRGTSDNFDPDKDPDEWHQGEMITYIITTWDIEYVLKLVKAGGVYPYPGGYDNKTVVSYAIYYERGTTNIQKIIPCPWEPEFYDAQTGRVIERPYWVNVTYDRPEPDPNIPGDDLHGEYPREYRYKDGTTDPFGTPLDFIEDKVCHGHVDVMRYGAQLWGGRSETMVEPLAEATLENPVNLAVYNSMKHAGTAENSANCYIINQPGYYKFPMVYGNGLKNGAPNTTAWTEQHGTTGYPQFVGSNGQILSSEKLPTIADAAIVTSNAQYAVQLVKIDQDYLTIYVDPTYIDQGNSIVCVRDGNGTILWSWHIWTTDYDPYADKGTVSVKVPTGNGWYKDERFDMMRFNLGWHRPDRGDAGDGKTPRRVMWRPVQSHRHEGHTITRTTPNYYYIEQDPYEATQTGAAPFYNWGRKDPLMKMVHTPFDKALLLDNSYYGATYSLRRTFDNEKLTSRLDGSKEYRLKDGYYFYTQMKLEWAIQLPWAIPFAYNADNPGATHSQTRGMTWWIGPGTTITNNPVQIVNTTGVDGSTGLPVLGTTGTPGNALLETAMSGGQMVFHKELWCIGQKSDTYLDKRGENGAAGGTVHNVVKTIYDPCPPLFTVPPARAMEYLNITNSLRYNSIDDSYGYVSTQYMLLKSHLCYGYTFYKDPDSKQHYLKDDDHTVSLPAMPFLSPLAGESTWDKSSNVYCLPYLSTFMNRSCSLWEADITTPEPNLKHKGWLSSYYNIKGMFIKGASAGGGNGMGPTETKSTYLGHTSTGNDYNNSGRQIRPVREVD